MTSLHGVGVSSGRASGPVVVVSGTSGTPDDAPAPADLAAESARIAPAAEAVAGWLRDRAAAATGDAAAVLETTAAMAADPALVSSAEKLVLDRGVAAAHAVHEAAGTFTAALTAAGGYLAERVRDVEDVRDRIVAELTGAAAPGVPTFTEPAVLVADDLAPADTAGLDAELVLALVTESGGPTSHTAILARSLGIPAVVACAGVLAAAAGAAGLEVDGDTGEVLASAIPLEVLRAEVRVATDWDGTGRTADGHPIGVLANVGSAADAEHAVEQGALGVGLFRTEFCYLAATGEPAVAEQRAAYAGVLRPFAGKPVVVRTLDAGADKPLAFLNQDTEPNPALGVRGLRVSRQRTGVLDRQLEAIAGAEADSGAAVSVMAPMVATAEEAAWFAERVRAAGIARAGVMIEVPAAALCAGELLAVVDFVSLGTNDLAQYTFAADRQLAAVAALNDPWQPASLRLVGMVGEAAGALGKPAGVCGEAAADPDLACVLAGLGATSVSMAGTAVRAVGGRLGSVHLETCRAAARAALAATDPASARAAARAALR